MAYLGVQEQTSSSYFSVCNNKDHLDYSISHCHPNSAICGFHGENCERQSPHTQGLVSSHEYFSLNSCSNRGRKKKRSVQQALEDNELTWKATCIAVDLDLHCTLSDSRVSKYFKFERKCTVNKKKRFQLPPTASVPSGLPECDSAVTANGPKTRRREDFKQAGRFCCAEWSTLAAADEICVRANYFLQATLISGTAAVSFPQRWRDDCQRSDAVRSLEAEVGFMSGITDILTEDTVLSCPFLLLSSNITG